MSTHITEQRWRVLVTRSTEGRPLVHIVGEDGSNILQLTRPDESSDLLIAGYIAGLQSGRRDAREPVTSPIDPPAPPSTLEHLDACIPTRMYSEWYCKPGCPIGGTGARRKDT